MAVALLFNHSAIDDVRLMIFDKDGTLIDVHTYWANMVKLRAEKVCDRLGLDEEIQRGIMDSMGVDLSAMRIKPEGPVGIKKREIVLRAGVEYLLSLGLNDETELFINVFSEVDEKSLQYFDKIIKPIRGLDNLFDLLKRLDCKIAVATTDLTDRAKLAFNHLGLLQSIDLIVGADMVSKPKPAGDMLVFICKTLNISLEHSVMVGDAGDDVLTGLNAGCKASIGVESGLTPRGELLSLTPYVVSDISAIPIHIHWRKEYE